MWEISVQSLGWEDPLEKGKATHSSILAWRIPWTVQFIGTQRVGHDWATCSFNLTFILLKYFKGKMSSTMYFEEKISFLAWAKSSFTGFEFSGQVCFMQFPQWMSPLCLNCSFSSILSPVTASNLKTSVPIISYWLPNIYLSLFSCDLDLQFWICITLSFLNICIWTLHRHHIYKRSKIRYDFPL